MSNYLFGFFDIVVLGTTLFKNVYVKKCEKYLFLLIVVSRHKDEFVKVPFLCILFSVF